MTNFKYVVFAALLALESVGGAWSSDNSRQEITLIVPERIGAEADISVRIMSLRARREIARSIRIVNEPSANGYDAVNLFMSLPADGSAILGIYIYPCRVGRRRKFRFRLG